MRYPKKGEEKAQIQHKPKNDRKPLLLKKAGEGS
jgi:hypothetical protein